MRSTLTFSLSLLLSWLLSLCLPGAHAATLAGPLVKPLEAKSETQKDDKGYASCGLGYAPELRDAAGTRTYALSLWVGVTGSGMKLVPQEPLAAQDEKPVNYRYAFGPYDAPMGASTLPENTESVALTARQALTIIGRLERGEEVQFRANFLNRPALKIPLRAELEPAARESLHACLAALSERTGAKPAFAVQNTAAAPQTGATQAK